MKTHLELLILVRNEIKDVRGIESGLCKECSRLVYSYKITEKELDKLYDYIQNNRPKRGKLRDYRRTLNSAWYWAIGDVAPRLAWLDHHIKKLSK